MVLRINSNACIFAILVVVAIIQTGSALRCYRCDTDSSNFCLNPSNSSVEYNRDHNAVDCTSSSSYNIGRQICKKIVEKVNGRTRITRSCDIADSDETNTRNGGCGSHHTINSHSQLISCNICDTDYCNGASSISGMQLLQACVVGVITCALSPSIRSFF